MAAVAIMIERHLIRDRESWLQLRRPDVTASAIAATMGLHPYKSALELFMEKSGIELTEPKPSGVLLRGLAYEPVVAAIAREKRPDWGIVPAGEYLRDPDLRLGASPDFYVECDPRGPGVMQVKTVAPRTFKEAWQDGVPPFWIQLQTLTEMMLADAAWGVVAAWILDPYAEPDVEFIEVPRHAGAEQRIRDAVAAFWADVAAGREPSPDYGRDADLIAALYPSEVPLKTVDLTGDNMLPMLLAERADIKTRMGLDAARCQEIETEIRAKMGDAEAATCGGFSITLKTTHRKPYSVAATSYRALRISDHRPKQEEAADDDKPF